MKQAVSDGFHHPRRPADVSLRAIPQGAGQSAEHGDINPPGKAAPTGGLLAGVGEEYPQPILKSCSGFGTQQNKSRPAEPKSVQQPGGRF